MSKFFAWSIENAIRRDKNVDDQGSKKSPYEKKSDFKVRNLLYCDGVFCGSLFDYYYFLVSYFFENLSKKRVIGWLLRLYDKYWEVWCFLRIRVLGNSIVIFVGEYYECSRIFFLVYMNISNHSSHMSRYSKSWLFMRFTFTFMRFMLSF